MFTRAFIQDGRSLTGSEGQQESELDHHQGDGGQQGAVTTVRKAIIDKKNALLERNRLDKLNMR